MPRERYETDLERLRTDVLTLGDVVAARLRKAVRALETHDEALARTVEDGDHEINVRYLALEADCIDLLALQQPVASDLRLVTAAFKLLTDLERVADLASNLGEYVLATRSNGPPNIDLSEIGTLTTAQFEAAMDAFATEDSDLCHRVAARDEELDRLCEAAGDDIMRSLIERSAATERERLLGAVNRVLLTIRDLERIGDHAVNIAARTLYAIESDDQLLY